MKKTSLENEVKLLEYIDGTLSEEETAALMKRVEEDPELKARLRELQGLGTFFAGYPPSVPPKNFTQRVMAHLDQYPRAAGLPIWKNVVLLAGIIITAGIATWLVSRGIFDGSTQVDLNRIVFQNSPVQQTLPSVRFDGKTIVNSIIIFNLIIAFLLLDRTVLRPWFQRRSKLYF